MEDLRVYIVNPGRKEEDVGRWFRMPVNPDEVMEQLGAGDYVIRDYELPFKLNEDMQFEEVNQLCVMVEELPQYIKDEFLVLLEHFDGSVEYLYENYSSIRRYPDCETIADVMSLYRLGDGEYIETRHGIYEIDR